MIRAWLDGDYEDLRPMVRECLRLTAMLGGDFADSEQNARVFTELGMTWARRGEPTLVSRIDETPVGLTLWGDLGNPMGLDLRAGPVCSALMTYVAPAYRHAGVATKLRLAAFIVARAKGYARVKGAVQFRNIAGIASVEAVGFARTAIEVEKVLPC